MANGTGHGYTSSMRCRPNSKTIRNGNQGDVIFLAYFNEMTSCGEKGVSVVLLVVGEGRKIEAPCHLVKQSAGKSGLLSYRSLQITIFQVASQASVTRELGSRVDHPIGCWGVLGGCWVGGGGACSKCRVGRRDE
jgi:hypothetical protein